MLSITEEERAIFDEKKKFSIKANMDDASLLGDLCEKGHLPKAFCEKGHLPKAFYAFGRCSLIKI